MTYGSIAAAAGSPRAARQVAWVLHTCSDKEQLPWHRVIGSKGTISIKESSYYEIQKQLLVSEGVLFDKNDKIDLKRYLFEL